MTSQLNVDTIVDKAGSGGTNVKVANTSTYVSDGGNVTQNTVQGLNKVWFHFNGQDNTYRDSFNISGVTDNGTGDFTHNFTNNMGNDDFTLTAGSNGTSIDGTNAYAMYYDGGAATTSSVTSEHRTDNGTYLDVKYIMGMVAGDLA